MLWLLLIELWTVLSTFVVLILILSTKLTFLTDTPFLTFGVLILILSNRLTFILLTLLDELILFWVSTHFLIQELIRLIKGSTTFELTLSSLVIINQGLLFLQYLNHACKVFRISVFYLRMKF